MAIILVTGCTRGLGRAMAEWFAAEGHTVVGCGRNVAQIEELRVQLGDAHHFTPVDLTDDAAVSEWSRNVIVDVGTPEYVINNAALMNRPAPLWKLSAAEFDPVIDVNIKGVCNVIRHFAPPLISRGHGVIVNFSSGWGRGTSPEVAPYCATKHAIEGLTQALAQELPRGLCTVAVNPGIIDTDMLRLAWEDSAASYPTAREWALTGCPFILKIGPQDNGKSMTVR